MLLRLSLILRGFGYCGAVDLFACGLSRFGVGVYLRGLLLIGGFYRMLVLVGFGSGLRGCFWFALRFGLGLCFGWCGF